MDIWNYNRYTGELINQSEADESPLEPGVFLIPAHATTIAPPEPIEGKAIVFVNEEWTFEEDHRGETWWYANGDPIVITTLGKPIDDLTNVEPTKPIEEKPELTPTEKLAQLGLTVDDLKTLLGLN